MLVKSGGLKKAEIGAIKITETQTFIEVAPSGVDRFMETIGPDMKVEKAITATRLNGQPDFNSKLPTYKTRDKGKGKGKPYKDKSYKGKGDKERSFKDKGSKDRTAKKSTYEEGSFKRKARTKTSDDSPAFNDPFMNAAPPKKKAKKPHKKKLARAAVLKAKGKGGVKKGARKNTRKKDRG